MFCPIGDRLLKTKQTGVMENLKNNVVLFNFVFGTLEILNGKADNFMAYTPKNKAIININ